MFDPILHFTWKFNLQFASPFNLFSMSWSIECNIVKAFMQQPNFISNKMHWLKKAHKKVHFRGLYKKKSSHIRTQKSINLIAYACDSFNPAYVKTDGRVDIWKLSWHIHAHIAIPKWRNPNHNSVHEKRRPYISITDYWCIHSTNVLSVWLSCNVDCHHAFCFRNNS